MPAWRILIWPISLAVLGSGQCAFLVSCATFFLVHERLVFDGSPLSCSLPPLGSVGLWVGWWVFCFGGGGVVWWVCVGSAVASSWCSPGFHRTHLSEFVRGSSLQVGKLLFGNLRKHKAHIYIYIYSLVDI